MNKDFRAVVRADGLADRRFGPYSTEDSAVRMARRWARETARDGAANVTWVVERAIWTAVTEPSGDYDFEPS